MKLFANEEERKWAIKLFWSVYVLDRRWSFGTGMPFALQDADIDPALPEPVCFYETFQGDAANLDRMTLLRISQQ